ncbi:MAG: homoserine kinase [Rhodospirillales bacterium]|nr:homoserine kinase [Rhodospirillales bacterium]
MAVYTQVNSDQVRAFIAGYDIGPLETYVGIADGVENTNYLLFTGSGRYILTLYEKRVAEGDLPYFLDLMDHLSRQGIPCPVPLHDRMGNALGRLADRPAALVTFLEGIARSRIEPGHCRAVGRALALLHTASSDFGKSRPNGLSLGAWKQTLFQSEARLDKYDKGLYEEVSDDFARIAASWPTSLPTGVIHADLFPDNVFFRDGEVSGLIDFYFACNDFFAYDLAICINAWCFERDADFNITKAGALLKGYEENRCLSAGEIAALPVLCAGSAMRFLFTRLVDWDTTPSSAVVRPKDPAEYLGRLRFHRAARGPDSYGLGRT